MLGNYIMLAPVLDIIMFCIPTSFEICFAKLIVLIKWFVCDLLTDIARIIFYMFARKLFLFLRLYMCKRV